MFVFSCTFYTYAKRINKYMVMNFNLLQLFIFVGSYFGFADPQWCHRPLMLLVVAFLSVNSPRITGGFHKWWIPMAGWLQNGKSYSNG